MNTSFELLQICCSAAKKTQQLLTVNKKLHLHTCLDKAVNFISERFTLILFDFFFILISGIDKYPHQK